MPPQSRNEPQSGLIDRLREQAGASGHRWTDVMRLLLEAADALESNTKVATPRRRVEDLKPGDTFMADGYGMVEFERWDVYLGQRTAQVLLLDYDRGRRNPLPDDLQERIDRVALAAASETQRHVHTCMSCGEAWFCPHQPGDCTAPPKVMPSLILRGPSGPTVFHHDCKAKK